MGSKISGSANLDGVDVKGNVIGDGIEIGGRLSLKGATFSNISLLGANVSGGVELVGSAVAGTFNADRMNIRGNLFLRDGARFANIDLLGARISGGVELVGSIVTGAVNADGMEVGGSLLMRGEANFKSVGLRGAKIGGNVELSGSIVQDTLNAEGINVGNSLILGNRSTLTDIHLTRGRIAGDLQLSGGTYKGKVDLTGSVIGGELGLSSRHAQSHAKWRNGAFLALRNAHVEVLQASKEGWYLSGEDKFLPVELTGFTFKQFGGHKMSSSTGMEAESPEWLISWIESQVGHEENYDPQPYTQLAQVLLSAGKTEKAKAIRYAGFEYKYDFDTTVSLWDRIWLIISKCFLGYGEYPFRVLYWFIGLVATGALLARWSKQRTVRGFMGLWYSLENALPLIEMNERFKKVDHGRSWLTHFFCFHKAFGFILATVLVAALSLLGT